MNDSFTSKIVVNNEYDYSNIVPKVDSIAYLVQYCDNIYKHFLTLLEEDKKRNESLKFEFKNYQYKKSYRETFEVYIIKKDYNYISCKDFTMFQSAINQGDLKNVNSLEIRLCLDYKRKLLGYSFLLVILLDEPYILRSKHEEEFFPLFSFFSSCFY